MAHFKSNLRDIEFNLFEVLDRQQLLGSDPHADLDIETARGILAAVHRLATGPLATSLADSDRNPPVGPPVTRTGQIPAPFPKSCRAFADADWRPLQPR